MAASGKTRQNIPDIRKAASQDMGLKIFDDNNEYAIFIYRSLCVICQLRKFESPDESSTSTNNNNKLLL